MNLKSLYLLPALLLAHSAALAAPKISDDPKPRSAEKIIYFKQNGKFGAKTTSGKIIVPAQYNCKFICEHGETTGDELLFLDKSREVRGKVAYSPFFLHSRQGRFLYQPMMYDLTADYFSEGKRRYVSKDGKVGFADRAGNLVTPAQHDWAGPFEYGYATFCDGCREVRVDEEHTAVQGGTWGMMDARGNTVAPSDTRRAASDIERNGKFYPHPFAYTAAERDILQRINRYKNLIVGLEAVRHSQYKTAEERVAYRFEIVSQPVQGYPYYEIVLFDGKGNTVDGERFLAGADGKRLYVLPVGDDTPQPLETYLRHAIRSTLAEQPERQKNGRNDNPFRLKDYPEAEALLKRRK